jgi:hypothetical protein
LELAAIRSYASQIQQLESLFNTIANGSGLTTKTALERAVTVDGGATEGADALLLLSRSK